MRDGNLRSIFAKRLPTAHWVPVETWSTGQGVPDTEYCFPVGRSGWIEFKSTNSWRAKISPHQVAWIERRVRAGGRIFLAVRRRIRTTDELWMFNGADVRQIAEGRLLGSPACLFSPGGPSNWDWSAVEAILTD